MLSIRLAILGIALMFLGLAEATNMAQDEQIKKPKLITLDHIGKLVAVADPQFSPDGKSIAAVVSRNNFEKNRADSELIVIDIASRKQRVLTHEREGISQPRWSPNGDQLAFLAKAGTDKEAKVQLFVMPMTGGDTRMITDAPEGVRDFA